MPNTGDTVGVVFPTLMPDLTDIADVQQAFTMYHMGIANWNGIDPASSNSVEGYYKSISASVSDLSLRPIGGGEVRSTEPVLVGPGNLPVPEGYIWLNPDETSQTYPQFPTVIYSPTDPSASLTMSNVGTIWINENSNTIYKPINVWDGTQWREVATSTTTVTTNMQLDSYTLVLSDAGKVIEMNSASANTLTIPPNSSVNFPIGTSIDVVQYGEGQTTIEAGAGVTLRSGGSKLKLTEQYSAATFYQKTTDEWIVLGDLTA